MESKQKSVQQNKLDLSCPYCNAGIELSEKERFDGEAVSCPHCSEDATLIRERIEHSNRYQWSLIVPEPEEDRR